MIPLQRGSAVKFRFYKVNERCQLEASMEPASLDLQKEMYETYFGLNESPFNVTPDPKFIFFSQKHAEAFSSLIYGIETRKGFIAITGEIGAGKTTICRFLIENLKGRVKTSLILNPNLSDAQLLAAIVEDFGIEIRSRSRKECFDRLNRFLLNEFYQGGNAVLIIDEAQDLKPKSLEQVRLLSNLETDKQKLLQIVLVGQPELRQTLTQPSLEQLRQRIGVSYHLKTLNEKETEYYIHHRLKVAGWDEEAAFFDSSALQAVFHFSDGIPRLINVLCDRAFLAAYAKGVKLITAEIVDEARQDLEWKAEEPVSAVQIFP